MFDENTTGTTRINWMWTNPADADFNYTMVYLNGTWQTNIFNSYYNYNATELIANTSYEISTHTVDTYGNVNTTRIDQTTKTLALNNPPYKPGSPSPSDGATNVSINADLSWSGGDPDAGDSVTYDIYFGTDSTPPLVAENQTRNIYVNAVLNGNMAISGAIVEYPTDVHIGAGIYSDAETEYINGTVDEVKIYNRAFGAGEIKADYEAGSSNLPPIADPNGPYTGTEGVPITFDGSGSFDTDGSIVSYAWDFGDGNTGTGVSSTHTYAQNGTYTVTLAVTDDGGATGTSATTAIIADTDAIEPQVTNPSATPATILNDNGRPRVVGTNVSQLNVTVTGDTEVDTVTINLLPIGGSAEAEMTRIAGTDIWTVTTNATAGINLTHNLVANATDRSGNSNTSISIQLTVLRRGDVFRDNVVDMKDAAYIARYLAGLEPAVPNFVLVSDVVGESGSIGDGVGNMKDGVYLARYLAGLEDEP